MPITEMSPSGGVGIDEYAVTGLPSGLNLDTGTGAIGGTPDTADANTADVTVTVSDAVGNTAEVPITFPAVAKGDQTLTGFQYSAYFGGVRVRCANGDGAGRRGDDRKSYSATPLPASVASTTSGALTLEGAGRMRHHGHSGGHRRLQRGHRRRSPLTVQATGTLSLILDVDCR